MGEAERRQSSRRVRLVADSVSGLRGRGAVITKPIGLDHEAELRPVEVDFESVDELFGEW